MLSSSRPVSCVSSGSQLDVYCNDIPSKDCSARNLLVQMARPTDPSKIQSTFGRAPSLCLRSVKAPPSQVFARVLCRSHTSIECRGLLPPFCMYLIVDSEAPVTANICDLSSVRVAAAASRMSEAYSHHDPIREKRLEWNTHLGTHALQTAEGVPRVVEEEGASLRG